MRKWPRKGERWLGLRDREEDFTDLAAVGRLGKREKFSKIHHVVSVCGDLRIDYGFSSGME